MPRRLTWHPGNDVVQGFTPDGKSVLFTSPRAVFTQPLHAALHGPGRGRAGAGRLPIPHADRAAYSPDGRRIAYNPLSPRFLQWKRYRGGRRLAGLALRRRDPRDREGPAARVALATMPARCGWATRCTSAPTGTASSTSTRTTRSRRRSGSVTSHSDFPVLNASARRRAGSCTSRPATCTCSTPPAGRPKRSRSASPRTCRRRGRASSGRRRRRKYVREFSLSPSAVRVAVNFRGEIVTVPAEKGDVRNLTNTTAAHERSPIWSPDGRSVAYFSDESGEYQLHVGEPERQGRAEEDGSSRAPASTSSRPGPPTARRSPTWTTRATLYWIDVATGRLEEGRRRPLLRAGQDPPSRVVPRLPLDRLRRQQPGLHPDRSRLLARAGQVVSR